MQQHKDQKQCAHTRNLLAGWETSVCLVLEAAAEKTHHLLSSELLQTRSSLRENEETGFKSPQFDLHGNQLKLTAAEKEGTTHSSLSGSKTTACNIH